VNSGQFNNPQDSLVTELVRSVALQYETSLKDWTIVLKKSDCEEHCERGKLERFRLRLWHANILTNLDKPLA